MTTVALRPMMPVLLALAGLLAVGAAWGAGAPLVRIARLAGYLPLTIVLWQSVLGLLVLAAVLVVRGRWRIPLDRASLALYLAVALLGIVLPHLAAFWALGHVPAAVHSVIIALVPIFALGLALGLRIERFRWKRFVGLTLGAGAVALLILPEASLPPGTATAFVLVSMIAPMCYALEGLVIANVSRAQAGPMQTLLGATAMAVVMVLPLAVLSGAPVMPGTAWGAAEWAILISGIGGSLAYAGYVAILRHGGAVFGAQVAYVVTASGVVWAMLLLGERPSPWFWTALALLFGGLFLVQPRPQTAPGPGPGTDPPAPPGKSA